MPTCDVCDELATKAELQELRDQLNAVLGDKEDGSKVTLFAKGANNTVLQAGVGLTLLGMAKNVAPKAVTDILLEGAATGVTWQKMASMNTGIKAKFGNGTTGSLAGVNAIANTAGNGAGAAQTAAKVGGTAAGSLMILATLAQLAASLGLNKATVDIFDYRINQEAAGTQLALDAQQASMLRLYEKNNNDIELVNLEIANGKIIAQQNKDNLQLLKNDLSGLNQEVSTFNSKLGEAQQQINQLQVENAEHVNRINELTEELSDTKADLTNQVNTVNAQLEEAIKIIESQAAEIEKTNERITLYEQRATEIETRVTEYENRATKIESEFAELRAELDLIKELNPSLITERPTEDEERFDKVTYYENAEQTYQRLWEKHNTGAANRKEWSSIVNFELQSEVTERLTRYEIQGKKHGFTGNSKIAATQTGVLELTSKLGDPVRLPAPIPTTITTEELSNNPQTFRERFEALLDTISPNAVTPEQIEDLQTGIRTGVATDLTAIFGSMIIPRLNDITDATSERKIAQGVQTGICNSLNGGSCPATPTVPNPTQGLGGMNNNLANWLGAGNLLQGQNIAGMVSRIDKTVHHATWGLEKIQGFASTAWKATKADKVLQVVNTTLLIHNAMMLSNNIFQTMGEAVSMGLDAVGVRDASNDPIDVNSLVRSTINKMLAKALGASNYAALTARIARANRIYQSGANVLSNVRSIIDSTQDIAETTGENVSIIGNALKKSGVVRENAYDWMPENLNNTSRVLNKLEKISNATDAISDITSEAQNISEDIKDMKTSRDTFKAEFTKTTEAKTKAESKEKDSISSIPEPSEQDEDQGTNGK